VLEPGAMIFIPVYWLHAVHGFGGGGGGGGGGGTGGNGNVASVNLWYTNEHHLAESKAIAMAKERAKSSP
jgi:hypothetical protein